MAVELREVPHFQLRTTPSFQLDQSIFLSAPQPPIWVLHPKQISSYSSLLGPSSAPSCRPAAVSCPVCSMENWLPDPAEEQAEPGPERQEGWGKHGREFIAFSFLLLSPGQHPDHPLVPGPWSSPALKSPVSIIALP